MMLYKPGDAVYYAGTGMMQYYGIEYLGSVRSDTKDVVYNFHGIMQGERCLVIAVNIPADKFRVESKKTVDVVLIPSGKLIAVDLGAFMSAT